MRDMLKILIPYLIGLFAFPISSLGEQYQVIRVYDGDTIRIKGPEKTAMYIMLAGIDAPEAYGGPDQESQAFGLEAKAYLSDLILDKFVSLKGYGNAPHPHKIILSEIYYQGMNINLEMVKQGYAEVLRESPPPRLNIDHYLEVEKKARETQKGMWSQGENYISPNEWRLTHSKKK